MRGDGVRDGRWKGTGRGRFDVSDGRTRDSEPGVCVRGRRRARGRL